MKSKIVKILSEPYPRRMRRKALQEIIKLGPDAREWAAPVLFRMVRENYFLTELFDWTRKAFAGVFRDHPDQAVQEISERIHAYVDQDHVQPYAFLLTELGEPGLELLWRMRLYSEYGMADLARNSLAASADGARFLIGKFRAGESDALGLITMLSHEECLADLMESVEAPEEELRLAALFGLGKAAPQLSLSQCETLVPMLLRKLKEDDERARTGALRALRYLGSAAHEALPALVRELDGPRPVTAMLAIAGIGLEARSSLDVLMEILRSRDRRIDKWPAQELPWDGQSLEFDNLLPGSEQAIYRYTNNQTTLLEATVMALGEIGPAAEKSLPLLEQLLEDSKAETSFHRLVRESIEGIRNAERLAREEAERDRRYHDEFMRGAYPIPPEDYEPCLNILAPLNSLEPEPAEISKILFDFLSQPEIRHASETDSNSNRDWVSEQADAIKLLGEYKYSPAVPLLLEKLERFHLTDLAGDALEKIGDSSAAQPLLEFLESLSLEDSTEQSIMRFAAVIRSLGTDDAILLPVLEKHLWMRISEWSPYTGNHYQKDLCALIAEMGGMELIARFAPIMKDKQRPFPERVVAAYTLSYLNEQDLGARAESLANDMSELIFDALQMRRGTYADDNEGMLEALISEALSRFPAVEDDDAVHDPD